MAAIIYPEDPEKKDKIIIRETNGFFNQPSLLRFLPLIGCFFDWHKIKIKRPSQPPNLVVYQPGFLTLRTYVDLSTFAWLRYLDEDQRDYNVAEQYVPAYTNAGLLSALLFTAWIAIFFSYVNTTGTTSTIFAVFWAFASVSSLFATFISIILLCAFNETASIEEQRHFIDMLNEKTFNLGAMSPLYLLLLSIYTAAVGIIVWILEVYGYTYTSYVTIASMASAIMSFHFFYANMTSCLYASRRTDTAINNLPAINLSPEEVNRRFLMFLRLHDSKYKLGTEEEFVTFIRTEPLSDIFISSTPLSQFTLEQSKLMNTSYLQTLDTFTNKFARDLYQGKIQSMSEELVKKFVAMSSDE